MMIIVFWSIAVLLLVGAVLYSFLPKFKYRMRDVKNAINDKLSDPVKDHGHQIDDAKDAVIKAQEEVSDAIVSNKGLMQRVEASKREIKRYSDLSVKAASDGNTEAVTTFVKEKQRAEARAKTFARQIEANEHIISTVRQQLEVRKDQIEDAEINREILEVQLVGSKMRQDMAKLGSGLGETDLGGLGSLQEHVNAETARAEAFEEVYGKTDVDLEAKYSQEGDTVDDEVQKLLDAAKR